jgi:hypothetical protein
VGFSNVGGGGGGGNGGGSAGGNASWQRLRAMVAITILARAVVLETAQTVQRAVVALALQRQLLSEMVAMVKNLPLPQAARQAQAVRRAAHQMPP